MKISTLIEVLKEAEILGATTVRFYRDSHEIKANPRTSDFDLRIASSTADMLLDDEIEFLLTPKEIVNFDQKKS